eukprot:TRINITY_DN26661_c0_g1_i6.p1 TRINITY_DN26661_c0_g1~~TRINITY_DN26661_c0_g1_i6.p1  ORF type:complete len:142 (+),score=8.25 TRINITY_DN26661_c0_g1_i6:184-609(+)
MCIRDRYQRRVRGIEIVWNGRKLLADDCGNRSGGCRPHVLHDVWRFKWRQRTPQGKEQAGRAPANSVVERCSRRKASRVRWALQVESGTGVAASHQAQPTWSASAQHENHSWSSCSARSLQWWVSGAAEIILGRGVSREAF